MNTILLAVVVLIIVVVIVAVVARTRPGSAPDTAVWPFYPRKLLSIPEQVLYFRLRQALPEHIVLAQVQLSRLLGVKKGNNYQAWVNRINRMSADFVVCSKDSGVIAVIELDDASHEPANRGTVDEKKDKALSSAEVRIIRWQAKSLPDETSIRAAFQAQQGAPADVLAAASRHQGRG